MCARTRAQEKSFCRLVETTGTKVIRDDHVRHGITRRKRESSKSKGPSTFVALTRRIERSEYLWHMSNDNRSPFARSCSEPRIGLECIRWLQYIRLCLDIPESIF